LLIDGVNAIKMRAPRAYGVKKEAAKWESFVHCPRNKKKGFKALFKTNAWIK
jgi:hypothetical protein